jgi:hypothetical protein
MTWPTSGIAVSCMYGPRCEPPSMVSKKWGIPAGTALNRLTLAEYGLVWSAVAWIARSGGESLAGVRRVGESVVPLAGAALGAEALRRALSALKPEVGRRAVVDALQRSQMNSGVVWSFRG